MNPYFQNPSLIYWLCALVTALMDSAFVALLVWRLKLVFFRQLKWPLVIASGVFWFGLWSWAMWDPYVWETCYRYIFTAGVRHYWPIVLALGNAGIALLFWWLAQKLPINPVLTLVLLGGIESFPGHLRAIYNMEILATPLLKGVSATSALVFGFFEFIFYWCFILTLASLLNGLFFHHKVPKVLP